MKNWLIIDENFFSWKKILLTLAAIALILIIITYSLKVYSSFSENAQLSPQSQNMLARSTSLKSAMHVDVWPPGYPLLLFVANKIHLPLKFVNLLLFYITLVLLFYISKKSLPQIYYIWLPLFYSLCSFNYYNLSQYTSEAMIVPLSIIILILLAMYLNKNSLSILLPLSLFCSISFISRYQALLWLAPIVIFNILVSMNLEKKILLSHLISFCFIAFGPISFFFINNYLRYGFVTGMDRFNWNTRTLPPDVQYYAISTGFLDNILLTLKTYFLDFISPFTIATHEANLASYSISAIEIGIIVFIISCLLIFFRTIVQQIKASHSFADLLITSLRQSPLILLSIEFLLVYVVITVLVWTIGNNDPIYTRFLYPSYVYMIIGMFFGYYFIKTYNDSKINRFFFVVLFLSLALFQLYKTIFTIHGFAVG